MHWTPDQINGVIDHLSGLVASLGAVSAGIVTLFKIFKSHETLTAAVSSSTPMEVTQRLIDNASPAVVPSPPSVGEHDGP